MSTIMIHINFKYKK